MHRSSYRLDDTSVSRLLETLGARDAALDLAAEARLRFRGGARGDGSSPDVLLRLRAAHDFAELRLEGATSGAPAVFAAGPVEEFLAALGLEPLNRVVSIDLSAQATGARVHLRHMTAAGWRCEIQSEHEAALRAAASLLGLDAGSPANAVLPRDAIPEAANRVERRSGSDRRVALTDRRRALAT